MTQLPTPWLILQAIFPYLKVAAAYAKQIQPMIAAQPDKGGHDSMFGAALSDADLSIQTMVEVALLGLFPQIRFYGEEYEQSCNTKYFRAINLGKQGDYLVTLDPIDGTQFYLDGHTNYQIILGILNADEFEAVIALTPAQDQLCYALRGKGCWQGSLGEGLEAAPPFQVGQTPPTILLGLGMETLRPTLEHHYTVLDVATSYSKDIQIPNVNGILNGELSGAVLRAGKFIDGAAIAFLAKEAGCIVTTLTGSQLPPLHDCTNYERPALLIATNEAVHQHLVEAATAYAASHP